MPHSWLGLELSGQIYYQLALAQTLIWRKKTTVRIY